ncbi:unnamed protein product, partial [Allacma fusca]
IEERIPLVKIFLTSMNFWKQTTYRHRKRCQIQVYIF